MSVKTIFKVLIGTIFIIVASSLLIELFNVTVTGLQIKEASKMAAKQSCVLFTQESYKTNGNKLNDVLDKDGNIYITGMFYNSGLDAAGIWREVYADNDDFKNFLNSTEISQYYSARILLKAMNGRGTLTVNSVTFDSSDADILKSVENARANSYYNNKYTTANLGIPYLDKEITTRMYQWNLAMILSNCSSGSIQVDENGKQFVNYKGFRCYVQDAELSDFQYKVYDLSSSIDANAFVRQTNLSSYAETISSQIDEIKDNTFSYDSDHREVKDNALVTVVGIKYTLPMTYQGITPLKNIINFAWNHEVAGMSDSSYSFGSERQSYDDLTASAMISGGLEGTTSAEVGVLPTSGKLVYTLVR